MGRIYGVAAFALVAVIGGYLAFSNGLFSSGQTASTDTAAPIEVRWLLAHQPVGLYDNAAKAFADQLLKESGGRLILKVLTPADVGFTGTGDIPYDQTLSLLAQNKAELSSAYTVAQTVPDPALGVLHLPFLFTSYDTAAKVFDGPIGDALLSGLSATSGVRALAFTYSGGYRIIVSDKKKIEKISDLKGLRVLTSGGPVAEAFLASLGAVPVSVGLDNAQADTKNIDAVETTYSRLSGLVGDDRSYAAYINETNHSLFTTTVIASSKFYDSLTPADQQMVMSAAKAAAQIERADSIAIGESTKAEFVAAGSKIISSDALRTALAAKAADLYKSFENAYGAQTVENIRNTQK